MKKSVKILVLATAAGLALVSVGCGAAPQATLPVPVAPAPAGSVSGQGIGQCLGQYSLGGACTPGTDIVSACQYAGGHLSTVNGTQACRFNLYLAPWPSLGYSFWQPGYTVLSFGGSGNGYYSGFPVITPDNPTGAAYSGLPLGIQVKANDVLSISAVGGWGGTSGSSYLGGLINFYTTDCGKVDLNGYNGSSLVTNGTLPAGLVGSDGTNVFMLGTNATVSIKSSGPLSIGFNIPQAPGECAQASVTQLRITRCADAAGNTYPPSQCL